MKYKVEALGAQKEFETETCKLKVPVPFVPVCFYFTYRNSEGGWYIQNLKIILFFLVGP